MFNNLGYTVTVIIFVQVTFICLRLLLGKLFEHLHVAKSNELYY